MPCASPLASEGMGCPGWPWDLGWGGGWQSHWPSPRPAHSVTTATPPGLNLVEGPDDCIQPSLLLLSLPPCTPDHGLQAPFGHFCSPKVRCVPHPHPMQSSLMPPHPGLCFLGHSPVCYLSPPAEQLWGFEGHSCTTRPLRSCVSWAAADICSTLALGVGPWSPQPSGPRQMLAVMSPGKEREGLEADERLYT